jgi:hypothetical protein
MKQTKGKSMSGRLSTLALMAGGFLMLASGAVWAAENQATFDLNGVSQSPSNIFSLESYNAGNIQLSKTAFLTDGTPLISGTSVPTGTVVHFILYVDNQTGATVTNVNLADQLDPLFAYTDIVGGGTLKVASLAQNCTTLGSCTAGEESTIRDVLDAASNLVEDAQDGNLTAGWNGTDTITVGSSAGNAQLDIPANTTWGILFAVTMQ